MYNFCRFLFLSALMLGSFVAGNASTFSLGSYSTTSSNPGFDNSATSYLPGSSSVDNGSASTYDVSAGTVWHSALGSSSYVSFNAGTGADLSYVPPNGDYVYTTLFSTASKDPNAGPWTGTMTILADDTVSVYLNGTLILNAAGLMGPGNEYIHCSDVGPGCLTPLTFSFGGILDGVNVLTFDVEQVNGANEGLDYTASIIPDPTAQGLALDPIPEPSSLALMSTGMVGIACLVRRFAATK
jgi:hypothetical protein